MIDTETTGLHPSSDRITEVTAIRFRNWQPVEMFSALLMHIPVLEIDIMRYRASQLHHDTGEYIPAGLNERYKTIADHQVQRNLYSAFLIRHSDASLCRPDFEVCNKDFQHFAEMQDALLSEMRANKVSIIPCWDF